MNKEELWLLEEKYNGIESEAFHADLERLQAGEPLAYVIGHIPFLSATIDLENHPLIPRVETEYWVKEAINEIQELKINAPRILDLCAGSGCIGIAVAKIIPDAIVHFAEVDAGLHTTIAKNIHLNGIEEKRTRIFGGDLFSEIPDTYDLILTNPPYLPEESVLIAESVKKYEPALALYGGNDGLSLIRNIVAEAPAHLTPHGILYVEHEPEQAAAIAEMARAQGLWSTTHNDQYNVPRYSRIAMAQ